METLLAVTRQLSLVKSGAADVAAAIKVLPAKACQSCIVVMNAHPTIVCGIGMTWLVEITAYQITAHIFLFLLKWNYRPLTPSDRYRVPCSKQITLGGGEWLLLIGGSIDQQLGYFNSSCSVCTTKRKCVYLDNVLTIIMASRPDKQT